MNLVILMGRLTRPPEVRYSQGEQPIAVAKFTLAVDRRIKRENEQAADFISCTAFGKQAEFMEKYTKQGTKLLIQGRWQTGNYTNKDGQKVYTNDCLVESVEFGESKQQSEQPFAAASVSDDFVNVPDDVADEGLPFQ